MATIDRADWHSGADNFPDDVPEENGATHIGMFVRWACVRGFFVDEASPPEAIEAVRAGTMSGRDLLLEHCDGMLWPSMLTDECAAFAAAHWSGFIEDYAGLPTRGGDTAYHIEDTAENYEIVAGALDERWARYIGSKSAKT